MKAYLVDLIDMKTKVRQRIWIKSKEPVSPEEMKKYVKKLRGLKVERPQVISVKEKTLPTNIRQELVEKVFPVFAK
jgi:3-deoxy-D-manno-octulosonic acid (KDO) 8-phosphate synthase